MCGEKISSFCQQDSHIHVPGCLDSSHTCGLENLFKTEKEKFVIFHCKTSELYICVS